jgi:hypothetical protein
MTGFGKVNEEVVSSREIRLVDFGNHKHLEFGVGAGLIQESSD